MLYVFLRDLLGAKDNCAIARSVVTSNVICAKEALDLIETLPTAVGAMSNHLHEQVSLNVFPCSPNYNRGQKVTVCDDFQSRELQTMTCDDILR